MSIQIQDLDCGLFGLLPGLTDVSLLFQGEAGACSPVELQGLKAGARTFQCEIRGPFGTRSKNGSVVAGSDVEGLLWLAFDELGAPLRGSICSRGRWLSPSTNEPKNRSRVREPVAVESTNVSSVF